MRLLELFGDAQYTLKKTGVGEYEVAKFTDRKEPESVHRVWKGRHGWETTSPAFRQKGPQEKHILLAKQFIKDGEPPLTSYSIGADGKISKRKME